MFQVIKYSRIKKAKLMAINVFQLCWGLWRESSHWILEISWNGWQWTQMSDWNIWIFSLEQVEIFYSNNNLVYCCFYQHKFSLWIEANFSHWRCKIFINKSDKTFHRVFIIHFLNYPKDNISSLSSSLSFVQSLRHNFGINWV